VNKYAIVMLSHGSGLIPGCNAFLNGLDYYDNTGFDYHVIQHNVPDTLLKKWETSFNFPVKIINFVDLDDKYSPEINAGTSEIKRAGWRVRFYRYRYAYDIRDQYDAFLIVDADMICLNNIMKYFKIAADTGMILMPNNTYGPAIDCYNFEGIRGASSPPLHNMPQFIDIKKWPHFYEAIWDWGLKETFGDMATIFRTIHRMNFIKDVLILDNSLWLQTHFYDVMLGRQKNKMTGKTYLTASGARVFMVHRRWWMHSVVDKFVGDIKGVYDKEKGINNCRLFWEEFKRLNTEHKVVIEYDLERPITI
jgi:hypothetical protein